jgi:four helix bundle protein
MELWEKTHTLYKKMHPLFIDKDKELASSLKKSMLSLLATISQGKAAKSVTEQRIYYSHASQTCNRIDTFLQLYINHNISLDNFSAIKEELDIVVMNLEPNKAII